MKMKRILYYTLLYVLACMAVACSDDDTFSLSTANKLTFSTDTLSMDTVFSTVPSSTYSFWVYNKTGSGIRCFTVQLEQGNQTGFRANVDGEFLSPAQGYKVSDVEIRKGDSLRVFVEVTTAANRKNVPQLVEDNLVFKLESGVEQKVNLNTMSWDADFVRNLTIGSGKDTTINSANKPLVVYGALKVDSGATLRIAQGSTLYFHDGAKIDVYGRLLTEGTSAHNVVLRGDRLDYMFDYLPYDRMSGQWGGVVLHSSSYGNVMNYTDLHSSFDGVVCDSADASIPKLQLNNSIIHNCQGYGLKAINGLIRVSNSQISNAEKDCIAVFGGDVQLFETTVAQFYPFAACGAALRFTNTYEDNAVPLTRMDCVNSIVTGDAADVIQGESSKDDVNTPFVYMLRNSLLRTEKPEKDTANIVNVIWEGDHKADSTGSNNFVLVDRDKQQYDFHLSDKSLAIDSADPQYSSSTDRDGIARGEKPDLGCYEFVAKEPDEEGTKQADISSRH